MIKIKLSYPYNWPIERQLPDAVKIWGKYIFYINEDIEECDYWVVFNYLNQPMDSTYCPKSNIILMAPEPYPVQKYYTNFLSQFSTVITTQSELSHSNKVLYHTGAPWFVNKSLDQLEKTTYVEKNKKISIITSTKAFTRGHQLRLDFALKLKEYFKDKIDLYGRGLKEFEDKWDVLSPYKYNVCIENGAYENYFTEKITDCFLSHTFPIYYGCPNLGDYFKQESFFKIDIANFKESVSAIEQIIDDETHYERSLSSLIDSKSKSLNQYNLFPLIISIIEDKLKNASNKKDIITLQNGVNDIRTIIEKLLYRSKIYLNTNF